MFTAWGPDRFSTYSILTPPTEHQLALLASIRALHRANGLLDPWGSPRDQCLSGGECWRECSPASHEHQGGVPLPYVGPDYTPGGVAVVGINLNDASDPLIEFDVTEQALARFRGDRAATPGAQSKFSRYSARSAHALITAQAGRAVADTQDGPTLVDAVRATARFQLVKCSPLGGRSKPTTAMESRCPDLYVQHELDLLKPGFLLAFGRSVHSALAQVGATLEPSRPGLWVGEIPRPWGSPRVYGLYHPAGWPPHSWTASQASLIELRNDK
jgi:hypothetical protein